MANKSKRNY